MKQLVFILLLLSFLNTAAQGSLTSSLSACYSLNGNAIDPVNALNGTLSAVTPTADRFATPNSAYQFNGTASSYIALPNSPLLKPNAVTVSAWIKPTVMTNNALVIFTKNSFGSFFTAYGLAIENSAGFKFAVYRQNGSGNNVAYSTSGVVQNAWHHVVFSIDNISMKIYINGVLENTTPATITSFNYEPTTGVILGGTNDLSYNVPYTGSIDNVRIYSRVLTAPEVNALYVQDPSCVPTPASSFSFSPPSLCAGGSVSFTDLSTNSPTAWSWQTPGAGSSSSLLNNPVVNFPNPGIYSVSLTASNNAGTGNTSVQTITVFPNPIVTIAAPGVFCSGQSTTLTASGAASYTWSNNQNGASIVVNPTQNSTYSVQGKNANGCVATAMQTVSVFSSPQLSVSGNSVICQGLSTSLLVSGSALTYTWSNGLTGNLISVSPVVSTVYTVTGTNANGCTNFVTQSVFVNTNPVVTAAANANPVCSGDAVILSGSGASTYLWSGGVVNNTAFYPTTSAVYTLTGTGSNGCKSTLTIQVAVNPKPVLTSPGSTTLNTCPGEAVTLTAAGANIYNWSTGDATPMIVVTPSATSAYTVVGTDANGCKSSLVFIVNVGCAGIRTLLSNDATDIYPNPFTEEVTINSRVFGILQAEVYNAVGQKLQTNKLEASSSKLNLKDYPAGIYFIRIYSGNNLVLQEKLLKKSE